MTRIVRSIRPLVILANIFTTVNIWRDITELYNTFLEKKYLEYKILPFETKAEASSDLHLKI